MYSFELYQTKWFLLFWTIYKVHFYHTLKHTHTHTNTHTNTHTHTHWNVKEIDFENMNKQMSNIIIYNNLPKIIIDLWLQSYGWDQQMSHLSLLPPEVLKLKFLKNCKKNNCNGPLVFKSQRVGYPPIQKLLHHYQHSKNQLNL